MAECKDCIHFCVCSPYTAPNESYPEVDGCKCFRATADVVPKSEVDELKQDLEIAKIAIDNRNVKLEGMRTAANSYKMHYEKAIKDVEVWKQNRFNLYQRLECYKMARQNVAREIFEEIEKITMHNVTSSYGIWLMSMGEDAFAELKKKYIGESDVKRDTV